MISAISPEERDRIQVARGLCILAVVLIHSVPVGLFQVFVRPFVNFAVAGFLFLSGMLSDPNKWNPWKRLKKVLIPYLIWVLVYTALNQYRSIPGIPIQYLKNLLTARSSAILYYVPVYCELTLLIPLFDRAARSKYRMLVFLISPIEVILIRMLPTLGVYELPHLLVLLRRVSCLAYISFFYLGFLIGNEFIQVRWTAKWLFGAAGLSVLLQMAEGYWYLQNNSTDCGTAMKLSAMLTSSLCCLLLYRFICNEKAPSVPVFKLLGDYSFGIYFSHLAIKKVVGHFFHFFANLPFPVNGIILILLSLLFVIVGRKVLGKYAKYVAF